MSAASRLAWRQARGAWRHFVLLGACVALGVAALVAVGSFAATLDHTLAREAKALTGGDLEIRAARPLDGDVAAALADLEARGATVVRVRELAAMARGADGRALLVELKAPGAGYPLYGRFEAAPPEPLAALLAEGGAVVQREALERLGVRVGDRLTLGAATFTVRGTVEREPDRSASLVTLGPRVFVAADAIARTGLVQPGSRVRYRALVRLPAPLAARETREALARRIADPGVRVASYDEAQPGLRRFLSQLASYLGLVGLASLFVGGIGVASSVATFVRRQSRTIAILKALGADSRTVLATFLWQTLTVGVVASLAGAVLGATLQPVLIRLLAGFVPFTLEPRFEPLSLARGVLMGALTTLLCALWPLLAVARGLVGAAWRLPRARWPAWRHGVGGLRRPGGHPARVVVALGAGVMLLVAVALLQDSLDAQIDHERRTEAPSFFFVDVQPDQREAFARVLSRAGGGVTPALTPIVRARLAAVNGERVTRDLVRRRVGEDREGAFYYTREYALTWSAEPPPGNVLTRGRWWGLEPGPPRISVEEAMAKQLGVNVGGRLTFDVQGVSVEAEVASLRKVDWQTLGTNFFVVFSPGALDGAPVTFVATARTAPAAEGAVADAVAAAFPNVTAIPVRDVLERVGAVLGDIAVAIRVMALFTVATGVVVMAGALTATRYQRLYESVVLRTLGATRGAVARAFAVEYGCLGAAAGLGGTALAAALAWIVLHFVLDTPWRWQPLALLAGVLASVVLAVAVGFLATWRLLGEKPLPVLRRE
ncbi:MAG: hypothetical protein DMD84_03930 [Candidatus Rokuibacteriota bacterium]|nr:MAG: hypothetical protein DMD84_03930 [Candidatus Rokubacteria bacterium]